MATTLSNEVFDRQLRDRNPEWGVRDLEAIAGLAKNDGLLLDSVIEMPANNCLVVFRSSARSLVP